MTDATFMRNRKKYFRPQGLLFSNNPGVIAPHASGGYYAPEGYEFGSYNVNTEEYVEPDWMVLTDDNRKEISLSFERIEERKRMINSRMRSVYIGDKLKLSCSWDMIPSRAFDMPQQQAVDSTTGLMTTETVPPGTPSSTSAGLPAVNQDPPPTMLRSWNVEPYKFTTDAAAAAYATDAYADAYDAADAAAYADAYAAAAYAAYATDADAYAAAAAAKKNNQQQTADICRQYLPIKIWNINL